MEPKGDDDDNRIDAALVGGGCRIGPCSGGVYDSGVTDCEGAFPVAEDFITCSGEVEDCSSLCFVNGSWLGRTLQHLLLY